VNTFMDGTTHNFDLTDPEHPRETYTKHTGSQVNMVSQLCDTIFTWLPVCLV